MKIRQNQTGKLRQDCLNRIPYEVTVNCLILAQYSEKRPLVVLFHPHLLVDKMSPKYQRDSQLKFWGLNGIGRTKKQSESVRISVWRKIKSLK